MSPAGATDEFTVLVRATLLDALEALAAQREAVVVVGAQAVYLHTGAAEVAIAEFTKDSDLAIDPRELTDDPRIEAAMEAARFTRTPDAQPGAWLSTRGARIPPHNRRATRRAVGLEAAMVDASPTLISALDPDDPRTFTVPVAGPAALLVAKLHKIADRTTTPHRLADKDAHDVYRLLRAVPAATIAGSLRSLVDDPLSRDVTLGALGHLRTLFADGPDRTGSLMAGRAEEGFGDPEQVSVAVSFLAADVLAAASRGNEPQ